jgi:hypothetical protein
MRTEELESEARKLVDFIKSLDLQIPRREPPHKHIGAIIADAVLQIGHRYNEQVRDRILRLRDQYPQAATTSGFLHAIKTIGAKQLLNGWKGEKEHKRVYDHAKFFKGEGVETFKNLIGWLRKEKNKSKLISKGLGIKDRTADYYRVLVGLPDAVKVDSRVEEFLSDSGINIREHEYKELRAIVQAAAKCLGERPIDLEGAIWNYQIGNRKGVRMSKGNDEDELKVLLSPERMKQLKDAADECNQKPETLASIWIIDHLRLAYGRRASATVPSSTVSPTTRTGKMKQIIELKFGHGKFSKNQLVREVHDEYSEIPDDQISPHDWSVNTNSGKRRKNAYLIRVGDGEYRMFNPSHDRYQFTNGEWRKVKGLLP